MIFFECKLHKRQSSEISSLCMMKFKGQLQFQSSYFVHFMTAVYLILAFFNKAVRQTV